MGVKVLKKNLKDRCVLVVMLVDYSMKVISRELPILIRNQLSKQEIISIVLEKLDISRMYREEITALGQILLMNKLYNLNGLIIKLWL